MRAHPFPPKLLPVTTDVSPHLVNMYLTISEYQSCRAFSNAKLSE